MRFIGWPIQKSAQRSRQRQVLEAVTEVVPEYDLVSEKELEIGFLFDTQTSDAPVRQAHHRFGPQNARLTLNLPAWSLVVLPCRLSSPFVALPHSPS
jgi:hypothetical protein